jgi:hypothetical protein
MSGLKAMEEATGPYYNGKRVHRFTDDELIAEIERCRREGMEAFNNTFRLSDDLKDLCPDLAELEERLQEMLGQYGCEGDHDSAARWHDLEYYLLWNECLDRDIWDRVRDP